MTIPNVIHMQYQTQQRETFIADNRIDIRVQKKLFTKVFCSPVVPEAWPWPRKSSRTPFGGLGLGFGLGWAQKEKKAKK